MFCLSLFSSVKFAFQDYFSYMARIVVFCLSLFSSVKFTFQDYFSYMARIVVFCLSLFSSVKFAFQDYFSYMARIPAYLPFPIQELDLYVYEDGINLNYFSGNGEWTLLSIWHERTTYIEAVNEYARVSA